ncbi:hypothetical protein HDU97_005152 [Phlyctochytrium planicorne]|nr:hypothetical protein HDU97_005152 [Phlyctochytrium planicorne]
MLTSWTCRQDRHRQRAQLGLKEYGHDGFISYRVASETVFASLLCSLLQEKGLNVFLDARCLGDGADWKEGFENGLNDSEVILYLISKASLEIMQEHLENNVPDNVLIEMQKGLERNKAQGTRLVPIMIGSYLKDGGALEELTFSSPAVQNLPPEAKVVFDELFKMNGFMAHPRDPEMVVNRLISGEVLAPPLDFVGKKQISNDVDVISMSFLPNGDIFRLDSTGAMTWKVNLVDDSEEEWMPMPSPKGGRIITATACSDGSIWAATKYGVVFRSKGLEQNSLGNYPISLAKTMTWERVPSIYLVRLDAISFNKAVGIEAKTSKVFVYSQDEDGQHGKWTFTDKEAVECSMTQEGDIWCIDSRNKIFEYNVDDRMWWEIKNAGDGQAIHAFSRDRIVQVNSYHVISIFNPTKRNWAVYPAIGVLATISKDILCYVNDDGEIREADVKEFFEAVEIESRHEESEQGKWEREAAEETAKHIAEGKRVFWKFSEQGSNAIPSDAIPCGKDTDGSPLFAVRTFFQEAGIIIGKAGHHIPSLVEFSWNGKSFTPINRNFQYLCGDPDGIEWISGDNVDKDFVTLVPGGYDRKQKEPIYVSRCNHTKDSEEEPEDDDDDDDADDEDENNENIGRGFLDGYMHYPYQNKEFKEGGFRVPIYAMDIGELEKWEKEASEETEKDIAEGKPVYWKFVDRDSKEMPADAIPCGKEPNGDPIYAARIRHRTGVTIGKAGTHIEGLAEFAYDNILYKPKSKFQVLCGDPDGIEWISGDGVDKEAVTLVTGGHDRKEDRDCYVSKCSYEDDNDETIKSVQVGRGHLDGYMYFPYKDNACEKGTFRVPIIVRKVDVKEREEWERKSLAETEQHIKDGKKVYWEFFEERDKIPSDAIPCGIEKNGDVLYAVRMIHHSGIIIGKAAAKPESSVLAELVFSLEGSPFSNVNDNFQYLCGDPSDIEWVSGDGLERSAVELVPGGYNNLKEEECFVGHTIYNDDDVLSFQVLLKILIVLIFKVGRSFLDNYVYFAYENEEIDEGTFEVPVYATLEQKSRREKWEKEAEEETAKHIAEGKPVYWKFFDPKSDEIPIICGKDLNGELLVGARILHESGVIIGKASWKLTNRLQPMLQFCRGGRSFSFINRRFQLLYGDPEGITWVNGQTVDSADSDLLPGGTDEEKIIYLARCEHKDDDKTSTQIGKSILKAEIWFPKGKYEESQRKFEVAVYAKMNKVEAERLDWEKRVDSETASDLSRGKKVFWKFAEAPNKPPEDAISLGVDNINGDPLYAVRMLYKGSVVIGKFGPHMPQPLVHEDGVLIVGASNRKVQYLCGAPSALDWTSGADFKNTTKLIPGGMKGGEPIYVGKGKFDLSIQVGLASLKDGKLTFVFDDRLKTISEFEVATYGELLTDDEARKKWEETAEAETESDIAQGRKVYWRFWDNAGLPPDIIKLGEENGGTFSFSARTYHNGGVILGRAGSHQGERPIFSNYLCGDPSKIETPKNT